MRGRRSRRTVASSRRRADRVPTAGSGTRDGTAARREPMTRPPPARHRRRAVAALCLALSGCAGAPLVPFSTESPPLILVPATQAGVEDKRGRFREIYCAVLAARAGEVPDHRPCDDALTRLGSEPPGTAQPVPLGAANRHLVAAVVPGIGYSCFAHWLQPQGTVDAHVRKFGYELTGIPVDALS